MTKLLLPSRGDAATRHLVDVHRPARTARCPV